MHGGGKTHTNLAVGGEVEGRKPSLGLAQQACQLPLPLAWLSCARSVSSSEARSRS